MADGSTPRSGDQQEDGLDLGSMFPEEERPPTPPPTFATYSRPDNKGMITIRLVSAHSLWAHCLWNASMVFSDYIVENPQLVKAKSVLELGAGGALPSIVCALEGAKKVVITDYPDEVLLENIRWNARQAGLEVGEPDGRSVGEGSGPQVIVAGHLWGKDVTPLLKPLSTTTDRRFDLLILSDLIFNHSQHAALLSTCERAISEDGVALVFHSHHLPQYADRDLGFFRMAKERGWEIEQVVEETKYGVMFEEDKGDERLRGTVWGWAMRRRDSVDGSQL